MVESAMSVPKTFVLTEEAGISKLRYPADFKFATKEISRQPQLLVRSCYMDLQVLALEEMSAGRHVLILGNSGIGKSGMLVHMLFVQLREGKEVYFMFRTKKGDTAARRLVRLQKVSVTEVEQGNAKVTTLQALADDASISDVACSLSDPDVTGDDKILLVDGQVPQVDVRLPCIVVASPRLKNYHEWAKNAARFYMGAWSKEELYAARDIFGLSEKQVDERVERGGPFPLLVFNNPRLLTDSYMRDAVGTFCQRGLTFSHKSTHRVVHLFPQVDSRGNVDYREFAYDFNSALYFQMFVKASVQRGMESLKTFVTCATFPTLQGLRGNCAEFPFAVKLAEGGSFSIRQLQHRRQAQAEGTLKLGSRVLQVLDKAMTHIINDEGLYLPNIPNQGCWDAFFTLKGKVYFLQFTVSPHHRKKLCFLQTVLLRLEKSLEDAVMMFALPPDRYKNFGFQKWLNRSGHVDENVHLEVEQYAVSVSLSSAGENQSSADQEKVTMPAFPSSADQDTKADHVSTLPSVSRSTEPTPRTFRRRTLRRRTLSNSDDDSSPPAPARGKQRVTRSSLARKTRSMGTSSD